MSRKWSFLIKRFGFYIFFAYIACMKTTIEDFESYIEGKAVRFRAATAKVKSKHELLNEEDIEVLLPFIKEYREMTK